MDIVVDDLSGPEIAAFLAEHLAEMHTVTPAEAVHALDLDALRRPGITFWSVRDGGAVVGCGAVKRLDDTHGEVKSMRVDAARRGAGVASRLLSHIVAECRRSGLTRLSLETGSDPHFAPARRLYERFGFTYTGPFGDYRPGRHNVFMTRQL